MTIDHWSDDVLVVELQNDPAMMDDLAALIEKLDNAEDDKQMSVVLNFSGVTYINSSNIAKLLRLRKKLLSHEGRKLVLSGINTNVWGLFLVTGLDKVFQFADSVSTALASVQLDSQS